MNQHDLYAIFRSKKHIVRDFSISWGQRHHPLLFRSCRASLRCPFKDIMPCHGQHFPVGHPPRIAAGLTHAL